jgi:uncharacterized RDD family membrane protein YckC
MDTGPLRGVTPRATFGQRAAAFVLDSILVLVAVLVLGAGQAGRALFLFLVLPVGYFGILEGSMSGQTLGKRLVGIRVVDADSGEAISYGRGFGRGAFKWLISAELLFGLGMWWMLWDPARRTWHDIVTRTTVVPVQAFPVDREPRSPLGN